jgi:uncharacterized SAM-binding protein YcdF (DUF218 family)
VIKSFFMPLTEPLGAIWLLMAGGTAWLLIRRKWQAGICLGVPTLLICLVGSTPLAEAVVSRAERPCITCALSSQLSLPSSQATTCDVAVVLGGGFYPSDHDFQSFVLDAGASRLVTGIELARQGKTPCLVLGGSLPLDGSGCVSTAKVQKWVESLCRTTVAVTNLGICQTTHDEALAFRCLQEAHHWRRILLVTSALHMPRSVALFKKQGITVTPVACDFRACGVGRPEFCRFSPFPRSARLDLWSFYLHEKIGWWVYRIRGWI